MVRRLFFQEWETPRFLFLLAEDVETNPGPSCYACGMTFRGGDLNAHSPLWDTIQPSGARGEQLDDWVIAHSASVLNHGTATLINRATGGLTPQAYP